MPKRKTHQEGHFSRPGATASRGCVPKLCCLITNHFMLRKLIFQPEGPEAASHWRPASLAAGEPARGNKPRLTPALQTQLHGQPGTQGGGITLPGVTAATPGTYEVPPRAPEQCFGSLGQHRLLPRCCCCCWCHPARLKGSPGGNFLLGRLGAGGCSRLQGAAGAEAAGTGWPGLPGSTPHLEEVAQLGAVLGQLPGLRAFYRGKDSKNIAASPAPRRSRC